MGRARVYGDDYGDWIDEQLFVAVQLESATAVDNAEAIMATPGVDGCWAGPADLALSMGIHPRDMAGDERHARALERIVTACATRARPPGWPATPGGRQERAEQGFRYLTAGSDAGFLMAGARAGVKTLGPVGRTRPGAGPPDARTPSRTRQASVRGAGSTPQARAVAARSSRVSWLRGTPSRS